MIKFARVGKFETLVFFLFVLVAIPIIIKLITLIEVDLSKPKDLFFIIAMSIAVLGIIYINIFLIFAIGTLKKPLLEFTPKGLVVNAYKKSFVVNSKNASSINLFNRVIFTKYRRIRCKALEIRFKQKQSVKNIYFLYSKFSGKHDYIEIKNKKVAVALNYIQMSEVELIAYLKKHNLLKK